MVEHSTFLRESEQKNNLQRHFSYSVPKSDLLLSSVPQGKTVLISQASRTRHIELDVLSTSVSN